MKGGINKACAACKYQRRRCSKECPLSPYFPADKPKMFSNAHRLFGVSNIMRILKQVEEDERDEAMKSIIYESDIRAKYPVNGCYGVIMQYQDLVYKTMEELRYLQMLIAFYKEGQRQQNFVSLDHYGGGVSSFDDKLVYVCDPMTTFSLSNNGGEVDAKPNLASMQQLQSYHKEMDVPRSIMTANLASMQQLPPYHKEMDVPRSIMTANLASMQQLPPYHKEMDVPRSIMTANLASMQQLPPYHKEMDVPRSIMTANFNSIGSRFNLMDGKSAQILKDLNTCGGGDDDEDFDINAKCADLNLMEVEGSSDYHELSIPEYDDMSSSNVFESKGKSSVESASVGLSYWENIESTVSKSLSI